LEYEMTPFRIAKQSQISNDSITLLKEIIEKGNNVYVFKRPYTMAEKDLMNDFINNYGFTLNDHSKTFCKIELSSNNKISNENCIDNPPIRKTSN